MKAQVLAGIRQMEMREVSTPKIVRDTDVLLKIEEVGVCGSDMHYYETGRIGSQVVQYPFVVGHECAGKPETLDQGAALLKPGDKLMMVGIPREDRVSFSPDLMRRKELTLINVRRQNHCTHEAIDLLASRKVNLDFMVTHRFDFTETQKAFDLVAAYKDDAVKVIIELR